MDRFNADFDLIIDTDGAIFGARMTFVLGDIAAPVSHPSTVSSGLVVDIEIGNIGGGTATYVLASVWLDGVEILPQPGLGVNITTASYVSDVPVSITLDESGLLTVVVDGFTLIANYAAGFTPSGSETIGISGTGAFINIDDVNLHTNPASITNVTTATPYPALASAIGAATPGDVIELGAGNVCEWDTVVNKSLTIRGQGMDETTIDCNRLGRGFSLQSGTVSIEDLTITNGFKNTGAGVDLPSGCIASISRVRFLNNESTLYGGAVRRAGSAQPSLPMLVDRCEFINNIGTVAGGALSIGPAQGINLITGCHFDGNSSNDGVATYILSESGEGITTDFVNCTFVNHVPTVNVRLIRSVNAINETTMTNCLFADNAANSIAGTNGGSVALSHCLFQPDMAIGGTVDLGGNITATPTFVDAVGGNYQLDAGSAGIDAGNADAYIALDGMLLDLAGQIRFANDPGTPDTGAGLATYLDMGAFEFQGTTPSTPCAGDVNGDNIVDLADLNLLLFNFGNDCN